MTIPRPTFMQRFAEAPSIIDPRATFTRTTTAAYTDRLGVLKYAPAGMPRWTHDPVTGVPRGVTFESARTNLWLYSEALDNAAVTKTSASISADSAAAPDGATTADTITISGASGSANQAVTFTAGNAGTVSCYFKQLTSAYARLRITDGTNTVSAWFNIAAGTPGTASAGAATVIYSAHNVENVGNGWYRCWLTVSTATSTAFTVHISAAASDNTEPANADSIYAWGAQVESPATVSNVTSYIPTTSATVTRNGDVMVVPTSSSWFSQTEGTMLFEYVYRPGRATGTVLGGVGDTFSNTIYISRNGTGITMTAISASVTQAQIGKTIPVVDGGISKVIMAWKVNDFAFCVNGGTVSTDTSGSVPVAPVRLGIGNAPYSSSGGTQVELPVRNVAYWPWRLSNAVLQTLTQ